MPTAMLIHAVSLAVTIPEPFTQPFGSHDRFGGLTGEDQATIASTNGHTGPRPDRCYPSEDVCG